MEWRRALVFGVFSASVGCTQLPLTGPTVTSPTRTASAKKEPEGPKRTPRPSTCIAFGNVSENKAEAPGLASAEQTKLYDQARRSYQQALQTDPKHHDALVYLARVYGKMGDYPRAVATYQKALQYYPKDASLWNDLGMCQARQKDWKPALESLAQAVHLDPENRAYNNFYAYCLVRAGHHDESVAAFGKLENEATAHYNVARMLHHMKQDDLCRQHLEKALAKDTEHKDAQVLLTELSPPKQETKSGEEMAEDLQKEKKAEDPEPWLW